MRGSGGQGGGQQVHPLSKEASRVTHSTYTLPLSLSVYTAHADECGMCCDFSVRLQPVFIEHLHHMLSMVLRTCIPGHIQPKETDKPSPNCFE